MQPVQIIGSYLSPYVRKVLVFLHVKKIPYQIDPIVPFFGDARFSKISPVRRIPVLIDDRVTLCDSSVICQYLEERHPEPSLYPHDVADRARARWLEEFADSRMGDVFIWKLFNERVINPFVFGQKTDEAILKQALDEDIPSVLDYLEATLPEAGFAFGDLSIADIGVAVFFRNASFAGFGVDAARWPKTAGFVARVLAVDAFASLAPFEERMLRTPIAQHRSVLAEMGAPISAETWGTSTPRRGMMRLG
jgi:glutathione S-transferase